ncbi:hypothetical protein [Mesorhizobium sp. M0276]|uniref:hypothetical protein n=1 Tax=Mesorhizobium sp. M0276 TaxID=2956928 RepID=UPI00333682D1
MSSRHSFASKRAIVAGIALVLPASIYFLLAIVMPRQYRLVVETALDHGWQFCIAIAVLVAYTVCALWALRARGILTPSLVILASSSLIAALLTGLLVGGPSWFIFFLGAAAGIGVLTGVSWVSNIELWDRLPVRIRSVWVASAIAIAIYLSFGSATVLSPVHFPRILGAFAILSIFVGLLSVILLVAAIRPVAGVAAVCYVVIAQFVLGSNGHYIPMKQAKTWPPALDATFSEWLKDRADLDAYRSQNRAYPVVFVSSEGGGIYAAAHAYGVLSSLDRHCPPSASMSSLP